MNEFKVECTFQGHYKEPNATCTVPMDRLREEGHLIFEMKYHVASGRFVATEIVQLAPYEENKGEEEQKQLA